MKYTQLAWRNVGRNRRRSVLSITATAIATMSVVLLFSLLSGMAANLEDNLIKFYTGEIRIRNAEYEAYEHLQPLHLSVANTEAVVQAVAALPGVAAVVPRVSGGGAVFQNDRRIGLIATGVDFEREQQFSDIAGILVAGTIPTNGQRENPRLVPAVVGTGVLERLGIEIGDDFTVVARTALRGTNAMTFQVVGVAKFPVPALDDAGFWAPLVDVQRYLRMDNQSGEVLVRLDRHTDAGEAKAQIAAAAAGSTGTRLQVQYWKEIDTTYSFIQMAKTIYGFMGLIFFVLASTVIVNTTMMAIFERKQEIGTLEAMGMMPGELTRIFFTESLILSFLGAAAGLVVGIGIAAILGKTGLDFTAAMEGVDFEITPILYPKVNFVTTTSVFVASIVVGAVTSLFPTRRITRIQPVEALREE